MNILTDLEPRLKKQLAIALAAFVFLIVAVIWLLRSGPSPDESVVTDVSVKVAKVRQMDIHSYVLAYGMVEAEPAEGGRPAGGAKLTAPAAGMVREIPVKEGQRVKAGDIVVRLDDRMSSAASDKANQALIFTQQQFERQRQLMDIGGTSQKALQAAQQQLAAARADVAAARGGLAQVQLASPVDGVVARINVNPGQTVDPNTIVAEIIDLNRLIVTANVPSAEAATLRAGQRVDLFRDITAPAVAHGTVSFLSPVVDSRTDTALLRIALPPNSAVRPGELVKARIVSQTHPRALAVPVESVVRTDAQSVIHLVRSDRAFQKPVTVGPREGDYLEITGADIHPGDTVVTTGAYGLPDETKITILNR